MVFNKDMKKEHMKIKYFYFPKDIIEVYWYEEGENDVKPIKIKKLLNFFIFIA